jgi:hypothetical protein
MSMLHQETWVRFGTNGIGLSDHQNRFSNGVRIANWVENEFGDHLTKVALEIVSLFLEKKKRFLVCVYLNLTFCVGRQPVSGPCPFRLRQPKQILEALHLQMRGRSLVLLEP